MAGIGDLFSGTFKFNFVGFILPLIVGIFLVFLFVFLIRKIREEKQFDILVEITPAWSIDNKTAIKEKIVKNLFGKERIIKEEVPTQTYHSYFTKGKYILNKTTGSYDLIIKNPKTRIPGIPYLNPETKEPFFRPITFGKYKRYIHLIRYSALDFKPISEVIDFKKLNQIKNVYDSDAINVAQMTYRDSLEKYRKSGKFEKYAPFIFMIIFAMVMLIGIYFQWKGMDSFTKQLSKLVSTLADLTNKLVIATK